MLRRLSAYFALATAAALLGTVAAPAIAAPPQDPGSLVAAQVRPGGGGIAAATGSVKATKKVHKKVHKKIHKKIHKKGGGGGAQMKAAPGTVGGGGGKARQHVTKRKTMKHHKAKKPAATGTTGR